MIINNPENGGFCPVGLKMFLLPPQPLYIGTEHFLVNTKGLITHLIPSAYIRKNSFNGLTAL